MSDDNFCGATDKRVPKAASPMRCGYNHICALFADGLADLFHWFSRHDMTFQLDSIMLNTAQKRSESFPGFSFQPFSIGRKFIDAVGIAAKVDHVKHHDSGVESFGQYGAR